MQSLSKTPVTEAQLSRLAECHLSERLIEFSELTGGMYNSLYRLSCTNNTQVIVKISPPVHFQTLRYEQNLLTSEVEVLKYLFQQGYRVPQVLAFDPLGTELGQPWFMMQCSSGVVWSELKEVSADAQRNQVNFEIGKMLAEVNAISGKEFGRWRVDHCRSSSWHCSFQIMLQDLLSDAADKAVKLPENNVKLSTLLEQSVAAFAVVKEPKLVLWDLHDGNVMVNSKNYNVDMFIDVDRTLWADPLMEFYFRSIAETPTQWHQGYALGCQELGTKNPLDSQGAELRLAWYEFYLALVMHIESAYRGYVGGHASWAEGNCQSSYKKLTESLNACLGLNSG